MKRKFRNNRKEVNWKEENLYMYNEKRIFRAREKKSGMKKRDGDRQTEEKFLENEKIMQGNKKINKKKRNTPQHFYF